MQLRGWIYYIITDTHCSGKTAIFSGLQFSKAFVKVVDWVYGIIMAINKKAETI